MYDFIQATLTVTAEFVAIAGLALIIANHILKPRCQPQPEVASVALGKPEAKPEAIAEISSIAKEPVAEAIPAVDAALLSLKEVGSPRRTRSKKAPQPKLQPMSVGAAAVDLSQMTSEQLRKECTLQGVNWRTGGDYGRPMKKAQMLAALR